MVLHNGLRGYPEGTAFPSGPSTGDKFLRTDIEGGTLCFYDGTRWLELAIEEVSMSAGVAVPVTINGAPSRWVPHVQENVWLMDWTGLYYVSTTNDGSNYWTVQLLEKTGAGAFSVKCSDLMTPDCKRVTEETLAAEAMAIFHKYRIDELPVVNAAGKPVGLIDVQDIVAIKIVG